ncbi:hypothetical protein BB559_004758 [Furculomyces boomerangus]|uniref:Uncharacterized protein n=2 Tax=Harpellales TaxID=61421 RepID=A0A2T9YCU5_9FUNG|nr:hypothetical protein BB559_004758 [Furculomyces boomerangus]PVZ99253.1 hypothetical protein BB558_004747 [Smittium angustum]
MKAVGNLASATKNKALSLIPKRKQNNDVQSISGGVSINSINNNLDVKNPTEKEKILNKQKINTSQILINKKTEIDPQNLNNSKTEKSPAKNAKEKSRLASEKKKTLTKTEHRDSIQSKSEKSSNKNYSKSTDFVVSPPKLDSNSSNMANNSTINTSRHAKQSVNSDDRNIDIPFSQYGVIHDSNSGKNPYLRKQKKAETKNENIGIYDKGYDNEKKYFSNKKTMTSLSASIVPSTPRDVLKDRAKYNYDFANHRQKHTHYFFNNVSRDGSVSDTFLKRVDSTSSSLSLLHSHLSEHLLDPMFYAPPLYTRDKSKIFIADEYDTTPYYGVVLLIMSVVVFVTFMYALFFSKLMPKTGNVVFDLMKSDEYYVLLVPITCLSGIFFVFGNWIGMKYFRHN